MYFDSAAMLTETNFNVSQLNVLRWIVVYADTFDIPAADARISGGYTRGSPRSDVVLWKGRTETTLRFGGMRCNTVLVPR